MSVLKMTPKTILAVDDDEDIRRFYARIFSEDPAFAVRLASGGTEALELISGNPFDCVILDLSMPGMDGFYVLEHIRSRPGLMRMPVVVVTGSKKDRDGVRALAMGADDYINKPFSVPIFEAKVRKMLERSSGSCVPAPASRARRAGVLEAGPLKMDRLNRRAYVSGSEIHLSEKEFDLLYCLFRKSPGLVRWDTVHREVWRYRFSEISTKQSKVLQVTLCRLKSKLGSGAADMLIVQKGQGLRLELRSSLS